MGSGLKSSGVASAEIVTVSFGERFAKSDQFDRVFKEGMALVERTAAYLDTDGRAASKGLKPPVSIAYATESMRLTTRLLELASWLLVRRAVKHGDITIEEARRKRSQIRLNNTSRTGHIAHFAALPEGLRTLIEESIVLGDRILQLDRAIEKPAQASENPVGNQQADIARAFGRPRLVVKH